MPDGYEPYTNPDRKPATNKFKWVPKGPPSGNGSVGIDSWYKLTLNRGIFRNDYFISDSDKTLSIVSTINKGTSNEIIYFPINNSFRKLQTPNKNVSISDTPYFIKGSDFNYEITLSQTSKLSSITFKYKCSVDIFDENLLGFIESSNAKDKDKDIDKIKKYRENQQTTIMDVDWSKYSFIKIKVYKSNDDDKTAKQWPADGSELKSTGYYYDKFDSSQEFKNTNIRFANTVNESDFVILSKIKVINDTNVNVKITFNNIMLFKYGKVNLEKKNLPCSHMSYAIPIDLSIQVSSILNNFYWPNSDTPTFSIKIFSPDQKINSQGFAHSLIIKFLIAAFEDNFASFFNFPFAYIIFVGPVIGKRSSIFYFDPTILSGINGYLIRVNNVKINEWADKFSIQSTISENTPNNNSNWTYILNDIDKKTEDFTLPEIDKISSFLYHDKKAKKNTWYRIEQKSSSTGLSEQSEPFKAQIYSEKSVLELNTTGSANSKTANLIRTSTTSQNFSSQKPLAIFTLGSTEDYFASNVQFKKGAFKFGFSGKSSDPNFLMSSHIFLRMWFHPGNEEVDYENPERFRNSETEIIFKNYTTASGQATKIVIGTPSSLDELLVSAPLIDSLNYFEIIKYTDGLVDKNNTYTPFKNQTTVKIVIGIYEYSNLNNPNNPNLIDKFNPPSFNLTIDSNSTYIETPIIKNTKESISAMRYFGYNNVISNPINLATIKLSNTTYGNNSLVTDNYLDYYKTFVKQEATSNVYAYNDLITLQNSAQPQKLVFKIPKYSLNDDNTIYYFVDFVTKADSFLNTKVNTGSIDLKFIFDVDFDNSLILVKFKIAAFFVNRYGTITERIFITDFGNLPIQISKYEYLKTININVPFYVSNYDSQIVFRLYYYPYSKSGKDLTEEEIAEIESKLKTKPQGLRLDDIQVTFSAGLVTKYSQTTSTAPLTINYEDLPLLPTQSLDSQQFWFASSDQALFKDYKEINKNYEISGAVYSPTWVVNLPSDVEVEIKVDQILQPTSKGNNRQIGYRTVPFDERITKDKKIAAVESAKNNSVVHLAKNAVDTDGIVKMYADSNNVNYYRLYNPFATPHLEGLVAGNNLNAIQGNDPNLCILNNSDVSIMVNNADTFSNQSKLAVNLSNGYLNKWQFYNTAGTFEQQIILQASNGLNKVNFAFDQISNNVYIIGVNQSSLIMKVFNPKTPGVFDRVNELGQNLFKTISFNYLIDGLQENSYDADQALTIAPNLSELPILETFNGLAIDNHGNAMVAYVLEGLNNQIQGRMISSTTKSISNIMKIFDMGLYYGGSELNVFCPVIQYYNSIYYLLFWCAGKLLLTHFSDLPIKSSSFEYFINPIYLVAGNYNLDDTSNKAHPFLKKIYQNGLLIINNEETETHVDIEMQAAGLIISKNQSFDGQIFVYYTLPSLDLVVKKVTPGGKVSKAYKIGD